MKDGRIVGRGWGMEMLLMGETIDAAHALQIGLITRLVEPEELSNSIASFVDTFSRNFSSAGATAGLFVGDEFTGRDPAYLASYRDNIASVTAEDVLDVAQRYLDPEQLVIFVVGNLEAILAGDPEHPEFSLEGLSPGEVVRIPLPDPFTMEYPNP